MTIACWTEVDAANNTSSQTSAVAGGLARLLIGSSKASDSEDSAESELLVEDESDDSMTPASGRLGAVPTGSSGLASKVKHRQACDPDALHIGFFEGVLGTPVLWGHKPAPPADMFNQLGLKR